MKQRDPVTYLDNLPPRLNLMRLYRRMRASGLKVRKRGRMECYIRSRSAFKKPGGRRRMFKRVQVGA